jgi:ubiquitin-like modifier-activating enzyme 5
LLKFGEVSNYVGYNALEDFFPTMTLKPNTNCDDFKCLKKQEEYQLYLKDNPLVEVEEVKEDTEVVHEDNDWGISLVESESNESNEPESNNLNLPSGLKVAYTIPSKPMKASHQEVDLDEDNEESLEDLMSRMKQI